MNLVRRVLLPLLLLAPTGAGEEADAETVREVEVALQAEAPSEEVRLGYHSFRPVVVEPTVPRFLFEVPAFRAEDPLFFRVSLGQTEGIPFYGALDRSTAGEFHDLLYLDKNRDLDLTNDGDPTKARVRLHVEKQSHFVEFLDERLDLPYTIEGKPVKEPYPCVFYYVVKGRKHPKTVQVERDGWRRGVVELGEADHVLAVMDDDCDGRFTTGDSWAMGPAEAAATALLGRDATRSMLFPAWSTDQKWTVGVKEIGIAGRRIVLKVFPAKETETDYFLRLYRARQSPEERMLKIDPLRPKADKGETVAWLRGKDVAYALEIGASPSVKKRVLLDFTAGNCIWCARMMRYTFRDREVVALCKNFVCAKIPFTEGAGDTAKYGVAGTPTYIVLENDGTEVARQQGFLRPTEFAAWLKGALK